MTTPTFGNTIGISNINNELRDNDNSMLLLGGISSTVLSTSSVSDGFYITNCCNSTYTNTLCLTWAKYLKTNGYDPTYASIINDDSGNIFIVGSNGIGGDNIVSQGYVMKFNFKGVLQWEKLYNTIGFRDVTYDVAGYVYATGLSNYNSELGIVIYKFASSDGALQWRKRLVGGNYIEAGPIVNALSSGGNTYFASYRDGYIAKYTSAGALSWQKQFTSPGALDINSLTIDSSENVYIAGRYSTTANDVKSRGLILKLTSAGVITWQQQLIPDGTSGTIDFRGISVDSSGNVYVTGHYDSDSVSYAGVVTAKYNSSGTIQWQKLLSAANNHIIVNTLSSKSLALDSSNSLYHVAYNGTGMYIYKYNSSGTLQFRRLISVDPGHLGMSPFQGNSISTDSTYFYAIGSTYNGEVVFLKMTVDGGINTTYLDASYVSTTNGGVTTPTFTSSAASLTIATSSLTNSNAADTAATPAFAGNLFLLPQV